MFRQAGSGIDIYRMRAFLVPCVLATLMSFVAVLGDQEAPLVPNKWQPICQSSSVQNCFGDAATACCAATVCCGLDGHDMDDQVEIIASG
jgi:hypothetical protein